MSAEGERATLKQIAVACGVSEMTVSRVLRNKPNVRATVRERVTACAERLGYRPDPVLSALINRRKGRGRAKGGEPVSLIVPQEPEYGWGLFQVMRELEEEIADAAQRHGYRLKVIKVPCDGSTLGQTLRMLYARGQRGVLLAHALDLSQIADAVWDQFAVVTLEPGAHNGRFHAVRNDFFQMGECAVKAFNAMGYRRIGYVAGPMDALAHFRAVGALAACRELLPDLETASLLIPQWTEQEPSAFDEWIASFQPDALIAMSTWPYTWMQHWRPGGRAALPFAQLNRPRWDHRIHGVSLLPGVYGKSVIQRLHQLLLDDACGIPDSRTIVRLDGHWMPAGQSHE